MTPAPVKRLIAILHHFGLPRLVRLGVVASIPPLWAEIAVLHFRGSLHSRFMWVPILTLPAVLVAGAMSFLAGERRSRAIFRPFAWLMTAVGVVGTVFHARGIGRQMGGYYNWRYNAITGPPLPAPPQVALLGLASAIASAPPASGETRGVVTWLRAMNAVSYVALAVEAGYNHWLGAYFNRVMFVPLILSPLLTVVHLAAIAGSALARRVEGPLSLVATLGGFVGFGFHIWNIGHRTGGFSWQNFFYGPPVVAPLQLTGQGVLGLLAALFSRG